MGYLHISNLYKDPTVLQFKEVYVLEKVHGTSAHVAWDGKEVRFFAGGCSHDTFVKLFDKEKLEEAFKALGHDSITVYGEGYGGKIQGMSKVYGPTLKFIAFDVKIGDTWLSVPNMDSVAKKLGLDVVWWTRCASDIAILDQYRDAPSAAARQNGMGQQLAEGIVIRPVFECRHSSGDRVIAKHKGEAFAERASTPRDIDPSKLKVLEDAKAIALEWVTPMRLAHVLDKLPLGEPKIIKLVIDAMVEDVYREAKGEIVESKEARQAIGTRAAQLFRALEVAEHDK